MPEQQRIATAGRREEVVETIRSAISMLVTTITDGSATIVISDDISIDQRNIGIRASVIPGGRIFR